MVKAIEQFKLKYRARKYRNRDDRGGIAFILSALKPGQTAMDIGAHKAGYLYYLQQQVGGQGRVYAFEPQLALYQYVVRMKELFLWKNVCVEHLALSDQQGRVTLFIPSNKKNKLSSPGATIVKKSADRESGLTEEVSTQTLDEYCEKNQIQPDFLKIDVEGNELHVFEGGIRTLQKYKPKILVEIEARHIGEKQALETFAFLGNLGYTGCYIHGEKQVPLESFSFAQHQQLADKQNYCNNFIFV